MSKKTESVVSPFSVDSLKMVQDFSPLVKAKTTLEVGIGKPRKSDWIWVHPTLHTSAILLELDNQDMDRATYFVSPALAFELRDDVAVGPLVRPAHLYLYSTRAGNLSFWHVWISEKPNRWTESAHEYAQDFGCWQRVQADVSRSEYSQIKTAAHWPEPAWPDADLEQLLEVAFKGRLIADNNHEVLRMLRGEA